MNYVLVSVQPDISMDYPSIWPTSKRTLGRKVLVSWVQAPLYKNFEEIFRQEDIIPNCYSLEDYGKHKASKGDKFELLTYEEVQKEYEEYCKNRNK